MNRPSPSKDYKFAIRGGKGGGRNFAQFPQSQKKILNNLRSLSVKFVISAYQFKGCPTVNDAKTNKSRSGFRINGDRFPNRAPQASKGQGGGSGGMHLGVIFMGF